MKTPILPTLVLVALTTGGFTAPAESTNTDASAAPAVPVAPAPGDNATPTAPAAPADTASADTNAAAAPVAATNSVVTPPVATTDGAPNFNDFTLILRRNVFDPNRIGFTEPGPPKHVPVVESFKFSSASYKVGVGCTAFFSGSGVSPSGMYGQGDFVNGFVITNIIVTTNPQAVFQTNEVILADSRSSNTFILGENTGLSRTDNGPWVWQPMPITYQTGARVRQPRTESSALVSTPDYSTASADNAYSGDTGYATGRTRTRRGRNAGGNNYANGFGGNGGGFNRNFNNFTQDITPAAPPSAADQAAAEAAAARLRARRAAGD